MHVLETMAVLVCTGGCTAQRQPLLCEGSVLAACAKSIKTSRSATVPTLQWQGIAMQYLAAKSQVVRVWDASQAIYNAPLQLLRHNYPVVLRICQRPEPGEHPDQ